MHEKLIPIRQIITARNPGESEFHQAVEEVLGDYITGGLVVVKEGHGGPTLRVELVEAGHPVPTEAALIAGARVLSMAQAAQADDLVAAG